jgi:TonB family protein
VSTDTGVATATAGRKTSRRRRRPPVRRRPAAADTSETTTNDLEEDKKVHAGHLVIAATNEMAGRVERLESLRGDKAADLPLPPPPPPMLEMAPERPRGPVSQSTNEIMRRRVSGAAPKYPRVAREHAIESTVVVRVLIAEDGRLRESEVISGDWELRPAVREALRAWRFKPHRVAGQLVETAGTLRFVFELEE